MMMPDAEQGNQSQPRAFPAATGAVVQSGGGPGDAASTLKRGRPTVARALKLAAGLVLVAFVAFTFASYLSVQSIDASFDQVVSIDQPSGEAATDMIAAADDATIAFLESLVSDKNVPSVAAESEFARALTRYESLVRHTSDPPLSDLASELFSRLSRLGRRLVADDQRRRRSFIAVQQRLESMDDTVQQVKALSSFEGDVEENARLVSNYAAAPSRQNKAQSLEELDEFIGEVSSESAGAGPSRRAKLRTMLADVRQFKHIQLRIISLTERSKDTIPRFLGVRSQLDRVLTDEIDRSVEVSLQQRSQQARQTVRNSKSVLVVSLVLGVMLGLATLLWVRKRITLPVARLMAVIGGQGQSHDSIKADLDREDEFGVLARALAEATAQQRTLEEELRHQALHDPLTQLPNRTLFKDRVEHALKRRRMDEKTIAVAFLDIDDFKTINDSLGHAAGDELLVTIAQRMRESLRTSDTPARLGGDEFAALLEDIADVADVAIPAQHILESVAAPIELEGRLLSVRGSIGIAIHQPGQGATELLRNADIAMYSAKTGGKGRYRVFEERMSSDAVR
jgi:diguanylate cyclase (GGDEF)-like protein